MITAPVEEMIDLIKQERHIEESLDIDLLKKTGCFVLKNVLSKKTIQKYYSAYQEETKTGQLKRTQHHITEIKVTESSLLVNILKEPEFVAVANKFFHSQVGADFVRVVKKDAIDTAAVFLHQDTGYQIGSFERYSLFIALTECSPANGGLALYPGTHHFGYLGDAGEINDVLPADYPLLEPDLKAGDIIIMHSAVWHKSAQNRIGTERVYLEVHLQHIDEPTTKFEICGEKTSPWSLTLSPNELFKSSRTQKLQGLYKELNSYKSQK
ncbi:phytanoyl-CoA dioxygenase family protein [Rheinheimera mangrovi]|uniref:phytanoyl-CoA dioxygenase family protein n=1 Tax=Rheinheimera mangrovi TaxID=2498451 RepID=UPI000F8CA6DD|nr:phytanoyl-CoA dioxygenase family protein [Rheinheimera mangrovi]